MNNPLHNSPFSELKSAYKSLTERIWLVIYTRPRWEKKVDLLLQAQGIESFCPVRKVENQWADRKKIVELPLFCSYVFVKINSKEEFKVRQTLGVLNFIYYMGKPAKIRESEIDKIKNALIYCPDLEVVDLKTISIGDRVSIKNGMFTNHQGKVIKVQGKSVLMILDNLECALVSRVEAANLVLIN
ncbi:UpxY family transcription antiterminator [Pedobacter sp. P351]|uniref:UpxY family transcription antiterminator n=1 Tax=Pedobacter superstes TaxID=3133441 RepID=UPI00309AE09D